MRWRLFCWRQGRLGSCPGGRGLTLKHASKAGSTLIERSIAPGEEHREGTEIEIREEAGRGPRSAEVGNGRGEARMHFSHVGPTRFGKQNLRPDPEEIVLALASHLRSLSQSYPRINMPRATSDKFVRAHQPSAKSKASAEASGSSSGARNPIFNTERFGQHILKNPQTAQS